MKKLIVNLSKKNKTFRKIIRAVRHFLRVTKYNNYYRKNNIDEKLIVFESYMGKGIACSPKAIYLELLKNNDKTNYKFVWFLSENSKEEIVDNQFTEIVKYNSDKYYEYYSKAKYIFSNSRIPEFIKIKKEQIYVQTWHGTPLKKLGYDIKVEGGNALNSLDELKQKYKEDAIRYSYLLSPSKFTTEKLSSAFNLKENNPNIKIIEEGYPRNDFLINHNEKDIKKIKAKLNLPNNKKLILYAPTWRDNQHKAGVGYTYDLGVNFDRLKAEFSDEYIILFRPHYFVANRFDFNKYKNFIIDVSKVDDINDLYVISDILITDYSSVFFDYANLKRPILFYMYDFEEYKNKLRSFYFGIKELPGPISKTEDQLISDLKNIDKYWEVNKENYDNFNNKFTYLDDGNASKRVIDKIFKDSRGD